MKKRLLSLMIAAMMIFQITTPAFAALEEDVVYKAQRQIMDDYIALCDSMGPQADEEEIFAAFLAQNPSLKVVSSSEIYFNEDGEIVLPTRCGTTNVNMLKDSLVYDDNYGAHIYFGYWEWNNKSQHTKQIDDLVAYTTSNPNRLKFRDKEACICGYDSKGVQVAVFDPDNNNINKISRAVLNTGDEYGAAYYVDDIQVRKGRIVVPADRLSSSGTAVLMTQYLHTWSETTVTGGAVSVGFSKDGVNIELSANWASSVNSWGTAIRSNGVKL